MIKDNKIIGIVLIEIIIAIVAAISTIAGHSFVYYFIIDNIILWGIVKISSDALTSSGVLSNKSDDFSKQPKPTWYLKSSNNKSDDFSKKTPTPCVK